MARLDNENPLGFIDIRRARGAATTSLTTPANLLSESALDTRLNAISSTTFSATRLTQMTKNDKVYAVRLSDESAGV